LRGRLWPRNRAYRHVDRRRRQNRHRQTDRHWGQTYACGGRHDSAIGRDRLVLNRGAGLAVLVGRRRLARMGAGRGSDTATTAAAATSASGGQGGRWLAAAVTAANASVATTTVAVTAAVVPAIATAAVVVPAIATAAEVVAAVPMTATVSVTATTAALGTTVLAPALAAVTAGAGGGHRHPYATCTAHQQTAGDHSADRRAPHTRAVHC
jgi:hypothetical protein